MAMFQLCVESPSSGVSWGLDDRRHVVKTSLSTRWWLPATNGLLLVQTRARLIHHQSLGQSFSYGGCHCLASLC